MKFEVEQHVEEDKNTLMLSLIQSSGLVHIRGRLKGASGVQSIATISEKGITLFVISEACNIARDSGGRIKVIS